MRGRETPLLLCRAVEILAAHFSAKQISLVVGLPIRSVYAIIKKARSRNQRLEEERKEMEQAMWSNIQHEATLLHKPVTIYSPIRRILNEG
jgi:hypothetical protein